MHVILTHVVSGPQLFGLDNLITTAPSVHHHEGAAYRCTVIHITTAQGMMAYPVKESPEDIQRLIRKELQFR